MKIALFYKKDKTDSELVSLVVNKIQEYGFELVANNPDVVLYIGGDGSFLRAVRKYVHVLDRVSFIGLCTGRLGFFYSYRLEEIDELLSALKTSSLKCESYRLLEASIGEDKLFAVNEIRIESPFHTLISDVVVNDEYLETFRGNGLVVCSAIGSSAYNKSLGGAVCSPSLEVLQLSEIAPINNRVYKSLHSSLILDENSTITLITKTENIFVGLDELIIAKEASEISFRLSDKRVNLLVKKDYSYISLIKSTFIGDK